MTTEYVCLNFINLINNVVIEVEHLIKRTADQNEIQDLLICLTIQTSRLHLLNSYLPFNKQTKDIQHEFIIETLNKLDSPQTLLLKSTQSMMDIAANCRNKSMPMNSVPTFKHFLSYVIKGFLDLKFVEHFAIENAELKVESLVLSSFKKAKKKTMTGYEYMITWGEGLYSFLLSLKTTKINVRNMLLERAQTKLLNAYHTFLVSDQRKEKFPLTDDPLFDISPFYIGAVYLMKQKANESRYFFKIALEEGTMPEYYSELKMEKNKMTTMEFLMESKMQSKLLISNMMSFGNLKMNGEVLDVKERLKKRLEVYGFKEKEVPGDGNCQMSSLSFQLFDTFDHAGDVRKCIVNWLRENKELEIPDNGAKLKDFVYEDWDNYCGQMEKNGTWGDHLTLIAAAEVFNCSIVVFSSMPGNDYITEIIPLSGVNENAKTLFLSHYAEFHFTTLVKLE